MDYLYLANPLPLFCLSFALIRVYSRSFVVQPALGILLPRKNAIGGDGYSPRGLVPASFSMTTALPLALYSTRFM
jgi:hypothetical protein